MKILMLNDIECDMVLAGLEAKISQLPGKTKTDPKTQYTNLIKKIVKQINEL